MTPAKQGVSAIRNVRSTCCIEKPLGFGPFRFPLYFTLQPHNSYVGAFADAGWIGGFAFLLLVGASTIICAAPPVPALAAAAAGAGDRTRSARLLHAGHADRHRPLALRFPDARRGLGNAIGARFRDREIREGRGTFAGRACFIDCATRRTGKRAMTGEAVRRNDRLCLIATCLGGRTLRLRAA